MEYKYKKISRFLLIGATLAIIETIIFVNACYVLEIYKANILSKTLCSVIGYFLHKKHTFGNKSSNYCYLKYIITLIMMIPTSTIIVVLFESLLNFVYGNEYKLTSIKISAEITCALLTFNIYRSWVYNEKQ